MTLAKGEMQALLAISLATGSDGSAPLGPVMAGFRRESEARSILESLCRCNLIVVDWVSRTARMLEANVARLILPSSPQAELLPNEHPLDEALADVAKIRGQRSEVRDEFPARVSAPRLEGVEIENKSTSYSNSNRVEGAAAARSGGAAGTDTRGRVCSPEADAAAAYIGEKLALPSMLHVLKEVTGGVEHMRLKFSWLMDHKPERLAELIGEAATPEVRQKARWLNAAMRKEMAV